MPKPVSPLSGCDVFVTDSEDRVLLIRRADNERWALPGGCQELTDTPAECAVRECFEETGFRIRIVHLLGVWSSLRYEYVHYPWKENVFNHFVFRAEIIGGVATTSDETTQIGWFREGELPPLSDGHEVRLKYCFQWLREPGTAPYFE